LCDVFFRHIIGYLPIAKQPESQHGVGLFRNVR
jgi:hypothetical protein